MSDNTEPDFPDLQSVLKEYRTWCLRNTPEDEHVNTFTMLVALVRPDGKIVTSMPGWKISEEDPNEEKFRAEMHGVIDVVLAKRHLTGKDWDKFAGLLDEEEEND